MPLDFGHCVSMSAPALTLDDLESDSIFQALLGRMKFSEAAEEWSRCRQQLTRWEDAHLLMEKPSPEKLETHRKIVERLMFFGQLFAFVASHPEFNDPETAEMIQANRFILREKYQLFHSAHPMSDQDADCILREIFPES